MNAIELFHKDGRPAGIYHCEKCRLVYQEKERAQVCCQPALCSCGTECEKYWAICRACKDKQEVVKEQARFAAAEKVTDFDGFVYSDGHGWDDGYFPSLSDLIEWFEDQMEDEDEPLRELPEYVWTCTPQAFCQLNLDQIIEDATQEAYEDWDDGTVNGRKELAAAIEAFNKANEEHVLWYPNYKRALLIPQSVKAEYRQEMK